MGAGSWIEVQGIPIRELAELYEAFDQQRRFRMYQKEFNFMRLAMLTVGDKVTLPEPEEFGVLR